MPKRLVVVLLDSLNRHLLGAYGSDEFETPNLDAFAASSVVFDNNYAGSLPCIPARHDLLCGALDFLWKPWGSIELWERPITYQLRKAGVVTKLVTDHPHLFEAGGENYHTDFAAWDYQRGHETDPWKTRPYDSSIGAPHHSGLHFAYDFSRSWLKEEEEFPGPKTMAAAAQWIDDSSSTHDRFFLLVDEFDPHEPFDTPEPYASMYDPGWEGPHLIWPPYAAAAIESGVLTPEQARQVRACYGAKLTMIDHWFGRLLAAIDRNGLADDTAVVVCTDHGHYLGEHDAFGKPAIPLYEPMSHTPLFVRWPGVGPRRVGALTTTVDLYATIADIFGVKASHRVHGASLIPLITGKATSVRDWALAGIWGREITILDGQRKYVRAPADANAPISIWSNRWSTMPIPALPDVRLPDPDARAVLDRMPGSTIPVLRQPLQAGDLLPFWAARTFTGNHLWHVASDPAESEDRAGGRDEAEMVDLLHEALRVVEAPVDHLERLGIS